MAWDAILSLVASVLTFVLLSRASPKQTLVISRFAYLLTGMEANLGLALPHIPALSQLHALKILNGRLRSPTKAE